jgi:hypothetical protein
MLCSCGFSSVFLLDVSRTRVALLSTFGIPENAKISITSIRDLEADDRLIPSAAVYDEPRFALEERINK